MARAIGAPWSPRPMKPTVAVCWLVVMIWFSFFCLAMPSVKGRHGSGRQEVKGAVPQPPGVRRVDGVPGDAGVFGGPPVDDGCLVAVLEIAAADLVQQRGSRQQYGAGG